MKKVGIITIIDNNNYGNRLQNYAVQKVLERKNCQVETIINWPLMNQPNSLKEEIKKDLRRKLGNLKRAIKRTIKSREKQRYQCFKKFNQKNMKFSKKMITYNNAKKIEKNYDMFLVGSDQVWNPTFERMSKIDFLEFAPKEKRNSLSASFGIGILPENMRERAKKALEGFNHISVREYRAKEMIRELTRRGDVEVLVDPTMMLDSQEWSKVAKKPKMLKSKKYILNYFLGELSSDRRKEIKRIAKENNCEIIDILDKQSPFYACGPSEFIYLEKNAFLVCTDSFHSCVFAILFEKPFIIFEREQKNVSNMNSRLDTLLKTFSLKDRNYQGEIKETQLKINYEETNRILKEERKKFEKFLDKVFERENKNE